MLPDLRLFQLTSPTLPVGGFTYSQGMEWAVEAGWVQDAQALESWLEGLLAHSMATLELPILLRLYQSIAAADQISTVRWCKYLLANRETLELRREERQRGAALAKLLPNLDIKIPAELQQSVESTQLAGIALAANQWNISAVDSCKGYAWSWLENSAMAGVKLIPLGQTQGQQVMLRVAAKIPAAIALSAKLAESEIGSSTPAQAIASSSHETQYTRLFRS